MASTSSASSSKLIPGQSGVVGNNNRVIALIDMDCFYVQVEERDDPSIKGKPAAVVQYNAWKGGSIIAVNYEARAKGVGRHIRGDEAKAICPEIILVKVPELRGKADLTKYRNAGQEVIKVLCEFCKTVERASVDEAYLDLTELVESKLLETNHNYSDYKNSTKTLKNINLDHLENSFVVPSVCEENSSLSDNSSILWMNELIENEMVTDIQDVKLMLGAELVGQMRKAVFEKTSFRCSAGIAHNKVLAKLACGINKPNKQTIVPHSSVQELFKKTKVHKVRNLGGKLGEVLQEKLNCEFMNDLLKFSEKELSTHLGIKLGSWIYQLARGFDDEVVNARLLPKSIGCNKMFNGPEALATKEIIRHWLEQLSAEVVDRLKKELIVNKRRAKSLTLHVKFFEQDGNFLSKSCAGSHVHYDPQKMAADAMFVLDKLYEANGFSPVVNLGLIASKFEQEDDISNCAKIDTFFKKNEPVAGTSISTAEVVNPVPGSSKMAGSSYVTKSITSNIPAEDKSGNSTDDKPKSFFNRNPSPKKNPGFHILPSTSRRSPKKQVSLPTDPSTSTKNPIFSSTTSEYATNPKNKNQEAESTNSRSNSKPNEEVATVSSSEAFKAFSRECEKCKKSIPVWEIECHMDWHMARDLQREINGLPPITSTPNTSSSTQISKKVSGKRPASKNSRNKSKRGRTSKNTSRNNDKSGMKTLDNYFTQASE